MITQEQRTRAIQKTFEYLDRAAIVLTPLEKEQVEVADFERLASGRARGVK